MSVIHDSQAVVNERFYLDTHPQKHTQQSILILQDLNQY